MANHSTIGIDVGGTKIAGGWLRGTDAQGSRARTLPTEPDRGGRAVLDDTIELARGLALEAERSGAPARAIGLGICELVDREGRLASENSIRWLGLPVREELGTIAPVVFEADVRAAALAEARLGAGQAFGSFLYVTVGTGISCCLMLAGQAYLGARGLTGTMASSPLRLPCERCGHVHSQTLEQVASGPALVARFAAGGGQAANGQDVLAAASQGDPQAEVVVHSAAMALGSQIALLVGTLDPEAVILGGGLGSSRGPFWEETVAAIRRDIWSGLHRDLPILRAATGVEAGWLGAALRAADEPISELIAAEPNNSA